MQAGIAQPNHSMASVQAPSERGGDSPNMHCGKESQAKRFNKLITCTASTMRRVRVAMPLMRCRKLSATRSATRMALQLET